MIYVIGGNGFVGTAYGRLFARLGIEHRVVTRQTLPDVRGTACDILINANGNSKKYLAAGDPLTDFAQSVASTAETLYTIDSRIYVFLSSGDVYPDQSGPATTQEDAAIDTARQSPYGRHKFLAESLVRAVHPAWLIVRMGGLLGPGLRKNAIFDMLAGEPVWLAPDSALQFLSTDSAAEIVWSLVERRLLMEAVNLAGRGTVRIDELHRQIGSASPFQEDAPRMHYELALEKLERLTGSPPPNTADEVNAFLTSSRTQTDPPDGSVP